MDKYDKNVPSEYDGLFQKAADANGVSYDLLRKVAWTESRFQPTAKSKTGPLGMMQFTKATAKAMGLNVTDGPDDDRLVPELSINAAAKHLAELVNKFDGDELKAALAYNQGEGRLGAPQLEAYTKGDFSAISEEGRNYMRNLMDVARSPMSGQLEAFGGITPKGKGIPSSVGLGGIEVEGKRKVTDVLPESTGLNIKGIEQEAPAKSFATDFWDHHKQELSEYDARSTFFGFKKDVDAEIHNSVLGMAFRAGRLDNSFDVFKDVITPTRWNSYVPTQEDLEKLRNSGLPPSYYGVITGGDAETWDDLIKLAKENYEKDLQRADSGIGAQLAAGIIGAAFDPLSYVPLVGVTGKGFKLINKALVVGAQSAAINMASEGLRTSIAGGEANYTGAVLGGLVFGAGMSAISDTIAAGLRRSKPEAEFNNEFVGPLMRMEARETAFNANSEDLSKMNTDGIKFDREYGGVNYAPLDTEPGAVVLPQGQILSDTNPLNPQTLSEFEAINPERAARGISLGGFTEIGYKTHRSDNATVRSIARDLVRSPIGMESGSNGKFGSTADDIHSRVSSNDNRDWNLYYDKMKEVMKDPEFTVGAPKMSKAEAVEYIDRKIGLAIEHPELQVNLSPTELDLMRHVKGHYDLKRELMENPAVFGNPKAVSIFPDSRNKGTYIPRVYDTQSKNFYIQLLGSREAFQEAIAGSHLASYYLRPAVKARIDEHLMEVNGLKSTKEVTHEMVRKHAMDKAYGISHTDQFSASSIVDENITGLVGIENNNFLEARNLFDTDVPITLPDGSQFSVDDIRVFSQRILMPAYDRRVNGDIAIMGSSGKTTKELKDEIMALSKQAEGNGKLKGEVEALKDTVKILTGRARRSPEGALETALRSLNDLTFFAKNFYMPIMNFGEISAMLVKGNVSAVTHGIPMINDWVNRRKPMRASEIKELHSMVFGKELDQLMRPSREDHIRRLRESTDTNAVLANVVGTLRFGTQELAARSPWTVMLNGTTNYIIDAARQGVLGDIASAVLSGTGAKFGKANYLKSASISPEQWNGIKQLFLDHATRDSSGKFTIKDKRAFTYDPRTMDLWRLADRVAGETILRPHKISSQDSVAYGAGVKMVMQFKNFVIKSLNARFVRSFYEATKNNRALDQALTHIVACGLAGGLYVGQAHLKAASLQEDKRKEYLKLALDPKMIAHASISRSSHLGSPLSIYDMIAGVFGDDTYKYTRSTVLPKQPEERDRTKAVTGRQVTGMISGALGDQIPTLGFAGQVGGTALNAVSLLKAPNKATEMEFRTGMFNTMREIVPNDPITQQLIMKIYEANGIYVRETPRK
uniref:Peptidoglycan transglycosylase gp16 n=1 Tax=Yersinia phage vB_YenP_WX1 TaxID=2972471 RepID=A0AAT9S9G1_9CAUD